MINNRLMMNKISLINIALLVTYLITSKELLTRIWSHSKMVTFTRNHNTAWSLVISCLRTMTSYKQCKFSNFRNLNRINKNRVNKIIRIWFPTKKELNSTNSFIKGLTNCKKWAISITSVGLTNKTNFYNKKHQQTNPTKRTFKLTNKSIWISSQGNTE